MFQRGIDVKEALGLGEFAPMVKTLRKKFEDCLVDGKKEETWASNYDSRLFSISKITDEIICKNIPDAGGGNVNKFIVWVHQRNNDPILKEEVKSQIWRVLSTFREFNCTSKAVNFYITDKYKRKYDLPLDRKGLILEIIYTKKK
jgi:hypothetical protein